MYRNAKYSFMEILIRLDSEMHSLWPQYLVCLMMKKHDPALLMEGRKAWTCLRMFCTTQAGPLCQPSAGDGSTARR